MHELSLTETIVKILTEESRKQGFRRVKRVVLEIGALSGVEPDSIGFCFDVVAENTVAQGAELQIRRDAARGTCGECGHVTVVERLPAECAKCGGFALALEGGNEMMITELEVE